MTLVQDLIIALGLAMDAGAISVASGSYSKRENFVLFKTAFIAALFFGFFQGMMLLVGGFGGTQLKKTVADVDHWVAFTLLFLVGIKMILDSLNKNKKAIDLFDFKILILVSFVTSIDALIVGTGLAFVDSSMFIIALIVGIVTAILSFICVLFGHSHGHLFGNKLEIVGGLAIIIIGFQILFSHLYAL